MKISKEHLLNCLESVRPGLSPKNIIEQSASFVFQGGYIRTFNDDVSCRIKCDVGFEGAVAGAPLIDSLRKLEDDELEITATDSKVSIKGKSTRKITMRIEAEITLPYNQVDKPKKWVRLSSDFSDAALLVSECASTSEAVFKLTCVHVTPKHMEACDNSQIGRYTIKTGLKSNVLIRHDSLKSAAAFGMIAVSDTENWVHFRNEHGLVFSCRRYDLDYYDLTQFLNKRGKAFKLPKGLKQSVERAEVFSKEIKDNNRVIVDISPKRLKLTGEGVNGMYSEAKRTDYKGPAISFLVGPAVLAKLSDNHDQCEITEGSLRATMGKFTYSTSLVRVEDTE